MSATPSNSSTGERACAADGCSESLEGRDCIRPDHLQPADHLQPVKSEEHAAIHPQKGARVEVEDAAA